MKEGKWDCASGKLKLFRTYPQRLLEGLSEFKYGKILEKILVYLKLLTTHFGISNWDSQSWKVPNN